MKIKICGLKTLQDIQVANEILPDYVGFVFAKKKREITDEEAASLRKALDASIPSVGVFVDAPLERVIKLLNDGVIQLAQLHGNESEEDIIKIQEATSKPVIKAVKLRSEADYEQWRNSKADYLLFDAGYGDGQTFDWSLLQEVDRPYFLAGGLSPENIPEAIKVTSKYYIPYCIDLSSSVEYPGIYKKDPEKMREAVALVRSLQ